MNKRFYDREKHCCSHCKMLCTKESFKLHSTGECFMIEMDRIKLKDMIKNQKEVTNALPTM